MKINLTTLALLFCIATLLTGCKTAIRNIEDTEFVTKPNVNLTQIKNAIFKGAKKAGWKPKSHDANTIIADYSHGRKNLGASVKIKFDSDSYSVTYLSSRNLKYVPADGRGANSSDFSSTITEYNPFQKTAGQGSTGKPATIHKIYNKWVTNLDLYINAELSLLHSNSPTYAANTTRSPRTRSVPAKTIKCNDQPSSTADGLAKITKASINTRSGASTKCAITGSVSRNETFTLLGRKNNWYYISLNNNQNTWVYAPLVRKIDDFHQQIPQQSAPAAPLPPTKNISIAVIRFKTLNKEAQEISLGELVSETFTSSLVNSRGFKIIEREQLDKVVKEMEMNQTGFIETTDAVEIGKMLHADAIITGSVALLNNQIQLNARIIEIESAYVISAETKTTSYSLHNITKLANEIVGKLSRKLLASNR